MPLMEGPGPGRRRDLGTARLMACRLSPKHRLRQRDAQRQRKAADGKLPPGDGVAFGPPRLGPALDDPPRLAGGPIPEAAIGDGEQQQEEEGEAEWTAHGAVL